MKYAALAFLSPAKGYQFPKRVGHLNKEGVMMKIQNF